jgi:branched-chain amino acid transport system ATP-binding protein
VSEAVSPPAAQRSGGDDGPAPLRLEGIVRRFGGLTAVDDISLTVNAGERLAIIGPNGAGKTTLFRVVAGEMGATAGRIHLFGRDVTRLPAHRRARMGLARTFQVTNLFATLSVEDNVRLAAQARARNRWRFWAPVQADDDAYRHARATLERVGIGHRALARVADLAHGEQRQVEIAMALATEPRLLLLDEPAAGLAAAERAQLRRLLETLPRSLPLVLIEHDMSMALGIADRVLCLHNGQPVAFGTPAEVRGNADVQAVYLGRDATTNRADGWGGTDA